MRNVLIFLVFPLAALIGCQSAPPRVPASAPPPKVQTPAGFEVSPERKQESLAAIRLLADKLNRIIADKDFHGWLPYLDDEYMKTYSDPVRLKAYSENSPFLKQFNVKLKTLEDYFNYVVVPSRANTKVDDISFVDQDRVEVWTIVDNERVLLYLLKLYGNQWKISSW